MRRTVQAISVAAALATLGGSVGAASIQATTLQRFHRADRGQAVLSSNWAGYAVSDAATAPGAPAPDASATPQPAQTAFTSVTGTWIQPKATCRADGTATYSAVWVGLGGFSATSQALEQIGTDADCGPDGKPAYHAWYELVPEPSVPIALKIGPGDIITTSVNVSGNSVLMQIKDRTRRTSFTQSFSVPAPDMTSAEWIVEAPSRCESYGNCTTLPLANFGSVTFKRIATTGNLHAGTLTDPSWLATPIQLLTQGGLDPTGAAPGASPADPTPDGRSFTVAWQADSSSLAPASSG